MTTLRRRNALQLLGAGVAFLAGCSETSDGNDGSESNDAVDSNGELPSYASVLPTTDRAEYFYGAIEFDTELFDENADGGDTPTDPLIVNPIGIAMTATYGLNQLGSSDAAPIYSEHGTTSGDSTFLYVDGTYVITGTFDRDSVAASLADGGYSAETTADGYAVFSHDESGEVVGVASEAFAYSYPGQTDSAFDPVDAVERTVATAAGQRTPKHEADDDFARLLRTGETEGITLCLYTDDETFADGSLTANRTDETDSLESKFDAFEGAYGAFQQLSTGDGSANANAVVAYSSEDRVDAERLESSLGTEASTVAVQRGGSTVRVDAEYEGGIGQK